MLAGESRSLSESQAAMLIAVAIDIEIKSDFLTNIVITFGLKKWCRGWSY